MHRLATKFIVLIFLAFSLLNFTSDSTDHDFTFELVFHTFSSGCSLSQNLTDGSLSELIHSINVYKDKMHYPFYVSIPKVGVIKHSGPCPEWKEQDGDIINLTGANDIVHIDALVGKIDNPQNFVHVVLGHEAFEGYSPFATQYLFNNLNIHIIYIPFDYRLDFKTYVHELLHLIQFKNRPESFGAGESVYHTKKKFVFNHKAISRSTFYDQEKGCYNIMSNIDTYFNYLVTDQQVKEFNNPNTLDSVSQSHQYPTNALRWQREINLDCCNKGENFCIDQISEVPPKYIDPARFTPGYIDNIIVEYISRDAYDQLKKFITIEGELLFGKNSKTAKQYSQLKLNRIFSRRISRIQNMMILYFLTENKIEIREIKNLDRDLRLKDLHSKFLNFYPLIFKKENSLKDYDRFLRNIKYDMSDDHNYRNNY